VVAAVALAVPACDGPKDADTAAPGKRGLALSDGDRGATASSAPADVDISGVFAKSHAVVIGIDAYQRVPSLAGAVRDAEVVAAALEARGFEVTTLLDAQATRTNIAAELGDRLHSRVGPDDRVLVFFAGHGYSTGDGDHRMGYLLPVEADRSAVRATGLSMSELQSWLAGYPSKHVLLVADACYSGLALATRSTGMDASTKNYLQDVTKRRVRFTLVAGRDDQEAHEDTQSGHGVFTRFFLEGLDGAADANGDGLVTSDELAVYVKPQVSTYVSQNFQASQTPQSARSGMGEFVFFSGVRAGATSRETAPLASQPEPASAAKAPGEPSKSEVREDPAVDERRDPPVAEKSPTEKTAAPTAETPAVALPPGVAVNGKQIVITTVSNARYRGNLVKATDSARKQQRKILIQLLGGPPFNVSQSRLAAEVDAVLATGQVDPNYGGENDDGDWELVMRYTAR